MSIEIAEKKGEMRRLACLTPGKIGCYLVTHLLLGVACVALGMAVQREITDAERLQSDGKFSQLRVALANYHAEHGSFPPHVLQGANGTRHSWRVLLLPYFCSEEQALYERYDFSQPWNGKDNAALLESLGHAPSNYSPCGDKTCFETTVLTVVPGDPWPMPQKGLRAYRIVIDNDAFIVVEVQNSGIHWAEPRDRLRGEK